MFACSCSVYYGFWYRVLFIKKKKEKKINIPENNNNNFSFIRPRNVQNVVICDHWHLNWKFYVPLTPIGKTYDRNRDATYINLCCNQHESVSNLDDHVGIVIDSIWLVILFFYLFNLTIEAIIDSMWISSLPKKKNYKNAQNHKCLLFFFKSYYFLQTASNAEMRISNAEWKSIVFAFESSSQNFFFQFCLFVIFFRLWPSLKMAISVWLALKKNQFKWPVLPEWVSQVWNIFFFDFGFRSRNKTTKI